MNGKGREGKGREGKGREGKGREGERKKETRTERRCEGKYFKLSFLSDFCHL
jgi:hypothetical protein